MPLSNKIVSFQIIQVSVFSELFRIGIYVNNDENPKSVINVFIRVIITAASDDD